MHELSDQIAHVSRLLRVTYGLRQDSLAAQTRYGARLLPRAVRGAVRRMALAETMLAVPKLAKQVNADQLTQDYKTTIQYLDRVSAGRQQPLWLRVLSRLALAIALVTAVAALTYYAVRQGL